MSESTDRSTQPLLASNVIRGDYFFLVERPRPGRRTAIVFGGKESCGEGYQVRRTTFPFITVEYVASGQGSISMGDGGPQRLQPGTIFTHGPEQKVAIGGLPGTKLIKYFVCLSGRSARKALLPYVPLYGLKLAAGLHAELCELFELLLREGKRQSPNVQGICDQLFQIILLKSSEASSLPRQRDSASLKQFMRCKSLIDENPAEFSTLQDLASRLGLEQSGLCRLFRRYQGISPYQYLLRKKMARAAEHLVSHGSMVKEVALLLGYPDPYHFSRLFKAVHGVSPSNFIRAHNRNAE